MTMLKGIAASTAAAAAALYILTDNARKIDKSATPSLIKYAQKLLPGFGFHKVASGDIETIVLDSHKDSDRSQVIDTVIMLHGFPDNPLYFYEVATILVDSGYRVILPSLPGYDSCSVTGGYSDKSLKRIGEYLFTILEKLGIRRFHLVGHDWGAAISAVMASSHPEKLITVTMSAVPHNLVLGFVRYPLQFRYSWYFALMQLPLIPEFWLTYLSGLRWIWNSWSPGFKQLPDKEVFWASVLATFKQPGVARDAVNFYRQELGGGNPIIRLMLPFAMLFSYLLGSLRKKAIQNAPISTSEKAMTQKLGIAPIPVPVLGMVGENDGCMVPSMFEFLFSPNAGAETFYPKGYKFYKVPGAGHFSFLERPNEIAKAIIEWFKHGQSSL